MNELNMSNDWRPDWRDEKAYYNRLNKNTSNETYAWEFLRRNITYQEDFEINKDLIKENKFYFVDRKFEDPFTGTVLRWKENMRSWYGLYFRSENYDYRIDTPPTFAGLGEFHPIANCESHAIEPENDKKIIYISELPNNPTEFTVSLSIDFDWDEQIKVIKNAFEAHKKRFAIPTPPPTYYVMFLRTLDALHEGLTATEIWNSCIYNKHTKPSLSNITEYIKKAEELRDGGYIRIVNSRIEKPRPEIESYDPITLEIKLKNEPLSVAK